MRMLHLLCCTTLALGLAASAAADPALVTVSGRVEIGRGTPPVWQLARSGDVLAPGDSVRTAAGARAELALGDQRIVRVYESSLLRVGTSVTPTGAVRSVELDEGQSIFDVMKKTVADEFEVETPEIVVSVKGTRFLVAAVTGDDYTAVFRGEVGLAGDDFEAISVRPGLLGARGELFLAPFADPWAAWESGASAPEPALDEGREREVGQALQAAVGGTGRGDGAASAEASDDGLLAGLVGDVGDLLGGDKEAAGASAPGPIEGTTDALGGLVAPVTDPLLGEGSLVGGTTDLLADLLAPANDGGGTLALAPVLDPVLDPLAPVLDPVLDPVTGGGSLLSPVGGLLGGLRSQ